MQEAVPRPREKKENSSRKGKKKTAQLAFLLKFLGDGVSMLELLSICGYSSSELLRSGSEPLAFSHGKGQFCCAHERAHVAICKRSLV